MKFYGLIISNKMTKDYFYGRCGLDVLSFLNFAKNFVFLAKTTKIKLLFVKSQKFVTANHEDRNYDCGCGTFYQTPLIRPCCPYICGNLLFSNYI